MNGHANGSPADPASSANNNFDVLVIGSGISGINTAYRVSTLLPSSTFAVLESRHELGGTWSQFKFPGIRSDSDLHTFGFPFNPWKGNNPIASGESILEYMNETVEKYDLARYIRYGQKVQSADWRPEEQQWRLEVDISSGPGAPRRVVYWTKWLILGTGYYSYDKPAKAIIPGLEDFQGKIVHPQFWPEDLDCKDKKVVVIGSGATAITLMPALVDAGAKQVTQLQRSPSYVFSVPQGKKTFFQTWAPQWVVTRWRRFINTLMPILLYKFCIYFPDRAAKFIRSEARKHLPDGFPVNPHLKPSYNPWEQRLCICPNADYFKCFESGRASIVTDTIQSVTKDRITLSSGESLDADIIITATGLQMQLFGGMQMRVDGKPIDIPSQYLWRFAMLTNLPNFGNIIGYWNHSWTLGSDISARLFIRVIKHMAENGYTSATPAISQADIDKGELSPSPLSSTYVRNGLSHMPKCADRGPWKPRPSYFVDRFRAETCDLGDGLRFEKVSV